MDYIKEEKKSSGTAKAGLALGIVGTSLATLVSGHNGGGLLGGLFGGGNVRNVAEVEQSIIAAQGSEIAELKAMRYTDHVGMDLYKNIVNQSNIEDAKINALQNQLFGYVLELDKSTALNKQAADYQFMIMNNKIDCVAHNLEREIGYNKELSTIADASIVSYANSTFIPGTLYLPSTSVVTSSTTTTS